MRIIVVGCKGQMGQPITRFITQREGLEVIGGIGPTGRDYIGKDLGHVVGLGYDLNIAVTDDLEAIIESCDGIIDVSPAQSCMDTLAAAVAHKKALVCASTGFTSEQFTAFEKAGESIPLIFKCNTSKMVNVMLKLVELAAQALVDETDIEIIEHHDRFKLDAPSGTANIIASMIAEIKGERAENLVEHGRHGHPRKPGGVGVHSLRSGDITSDHKVYFGGFGERLEITHYAYNDDCFARG
ncbi:MAG: 4-hydroxy-tetrahydrodipicolinate reductase, partial [Raoultibacter sp.]